MGTLTQDKAFAVGQVGELVLFVLKYKLRRC